MRIGATAILEPLDFINNYIEDVKVLLDGVNRKQVEFMIEGLLDAWRHGKRVLMMGNGGSSSSVSHIVNDFQKCVQLETGKPIKALCLSDCTPLMMAWANDTAWDNIFAPQVACWVEPGDIVLGVSGSGNSMNVIKALEIANAAGAVTFGMAGFQGGKLKDTAAQCIVIPSDNMQRIEDIHMVLLHILFAAVLERARIEALQERQEAPAA